MKDFPIQNIHSCASHFLCHHLWLKAVLDGDINPGRVFTTSYQLEDIDRAYKDMDERKTIKAMIVIE